MGVVDVVHGLPQLDDPPEREGLEVVVGNGPPVVVERLVVVAAIVEEVADVDACLGLVGLQIERPAQPEQRRPVVTQAMRCVTEARRRLGRLGMVLDGRLEVPARLREAPLPEERAPDLQDQVVILVESQGADALEAPQTAHPVPKLQPGFAGTGQRVFLVGLQRKRLVEGLPRPRKLVAREPRVAQRDVQFRRQREDGQGLPEQREGLVVPP